MEMQWENTKYCKKLGKKQLEFKICTLSLDDAPEKHYTEKAKHYEIIMGCWAYIVPHGKKGSYGVCLSGRGMEFG